MMGLVVGYGCGLQKKLLGICSAAVTAAAAAAAAGFLPAAPRAACPRDSRQNVGATLLSTITV